MGWKEKGSGITVITPLHVSKGPATTQRRGTGGSVGDDDMKGAASNKGSTPPERQAASLGCCVGGGRDQHDICPRCNLDPAASVISIKAGSRDTRREFSNLSPVSSSQLPGFLTASQHLLSLAWLELFPALAEPATYRGPGVESVAAVSRRVRASQCCAGGQLRPTQ